MTKLCTLIAIILCSAGILSAQTGGNANLKFRHDQKKSPTAQKLLSKIQVMQNAADMPARKTTAAQRLRAEAAFYPGGVGLRDSVVYTYSGSNGSVFDFNYMEYNTQRHFPFFFEEFVDYDTAYFYNTGFPTPYRSEYIAYSPSGNVLQQGDEYEATVWIYNTQDQVIASYELDWNTGSSVWDTTYKTYISYNGQQVLSDSTVRWDGSNWENDSKTAYTYTAGINTPVALTYSEWDGSNWENEYRIEVTYTAGAQLETILYLEDHGSGWENESKDTIGYTGNQKIFLLSHEWNGTAWDLVSEEHRRLNASNLPDSIFMRDNWSGAWDTVYGKAAYNSFDNPVSLTVYDNEMNVDEVKLFYYEEFSTGLSGDIAAAQAPVTIYPNPVTDQLHIQAGHTSGERLSYTIINNLGQVMMQATHKSVTDQAIPVPVRHLAPGIYRIQVLNADNTIHTISFLKD